MFSVDLTRHKKAKIMLLSTFELLLKPQFPKGASTSPSVAALSRTVLQGYFLTVANVNFFDVTISLVFTIRFPKDTTPESPSSFKDFINAVDITGSNNLTPPIPLVPELVPANNKARITYTIPSNATSLLVLLPNFVSNPRFLTDANFEARGYVEIFLSSLSGSDSATLMVAPQQRGTFFRDLSATEFPNIGLDQIAYDLPVSNGGVFQLSNA